MKSRSALRNCVVVSDLHLGCQFALCPKTVRLDGGGLYHANKHQCVLWDWWGRFWGEWVPTVTQGEPFMVVVNGDVLENRHHKSTTQISQNLADQRKLAELVLSPVAKACRGNLFIVRGTGAHSGESGEDEESIAQMLGAVRDDDGSYSRNDLWLRVGGGLVHFLHHIGTTGSLHYESTALQKEFAESCADAARWGLPAPDVVVRSHRHRHSEVRVPTRNGYGISFVTSSWQLKTPLAWRVAGARLTLPTVGGSLIRQGDEELYTRHRTWYLERSKTVEVCA